LRNFTTRTTQKTLQPINHTVRKMFMALMDVRL
jgi:hypothetical protein